jgi:hypothetical protein
MWGQVVSILGGSDTDWYYIDVRVAIGFGWGGMGILVAIHLGCHYVLGALCWVQELEFEGNTLGCVLHGCSIAVPGCGNRA